MTAVGMTLFALSLVSAGALLAAIGACVRRRWQLAVGLCRPVAIAGPVALVLAGAVVVARAGSSNVAARAATLASGISEVMNCGIVLFLAALASAILWAVGGWRLRVARRRSG